MAPSLEESSIMKTSTTIRAKSLPIRTQSNIEIKTSAGKALGESLPISNPCLSYWQQTTRGFPLLNANHNTTAPTTSKYVIIGSGISGALTAFELVEGGVPGEDITILEAREAASGASGRNAGHVRPDAFRGFTGYSTLHGRTQALKIIANERLVLQRVDEFVKKHFVPCDFNLTSTFEVCMTPEFAAYEAKSYDAYVEAGGDVSHVKFYKGEEARQRTNVQKAIVAYEWPAGSSHPAKLAQWLLSSVVQKGARLLTHCPGTEIVRSGDNDWKISTPRGDIVAQTVIHCTNAHASLLLPHLASHITPNRAQAHSLVAPSCFSGEKALTNTYSLRFSLKHFYSLIQRRDDGTLILGVSRSNPTLSAAALNGNLSIDDSKYSEEILEDALRNFGNVFPEYEKGQRHGEGLQHAWSGIVAMTPDSVPFVGEVHGCAGQWICAGFGAHGMARIFTCAPGVAKLVLGGKWDDTGLPECFQATKDRLVKLENTMGATVL